MDIPVVITGDLRPDWLIRMEAALQEAEAEGWRPQARIVMEGHPYIWDGEQRMTTWTLGSDE